MFCSTDLSGVINTLGSMNFDHIIPLDLFGTNDPTNIQLLCKDCNMRKLNRNTGEGRLYAPWFV
ncbi:HNH endonuclease [Terrimonas ginsenosidimutans]|uniref:HNH endonuclease n=1 Tax=Terrimonas ginsenosidimutans TaxID=2908004 RepID=UPI003D79F640